MPSQDALYHTAGAYPPACQELGPGSQTIQQRRYQQSQSHFRQGASHVAVAQDWPLQLFPLTPPTQNLAQSS